MATINLLTIHYGGCFGAVMQTYSTVKLLEKFGHKVNVINLIHPREKKLFRLDKDSIALLIQEFNYWRFKKKYISNLTNKAYSIEKIEMPSSDITIVGSDQVWNRDITGVFGNTFFLDYVQGPQTRIALSSSFGKTNWDEDESYTEEIKTLLFKFSAISVREDTGVEILKNIFGLPSVQLMDPTLAYGDFDNMIDPKASNFLFPYLLRHEESDMELVEHISKKMDAPVLRPSFLRNIFCSGPIDKLNNIKNAKCVVTSSFHGVALSIVFHKQFFVLCADESKFTRILSLLNLLGLKDRIVDSISDFDSRNIQNKSIDYNKVDNILRIEREKYTSFLSNNL